MIADNISMVNDRIKKAAQACGRNPGDIRLVCVTKGRSIEEIEEVVRRGISDIGENKVQEAKAKYRSFVPTRRKMQVGTQDDRVRWHMVGHLQTNKAREAVRMFDLIHSLDSLKLAKEINKEAEKINKVQDALIEVNTSGEAAKFGVAPDGLMGLVKEVISLKNVRLLGLMTIAPIVRDKEETRPYFRKLRELRDCVACSEPVIGIASSPPSGAPRNDAARNHRRPPRNDASCPSLRASPAAGGQDTKCQGRSNLVTQHLSFTVLSMGMSQDYEVAIEEGATMVRIGTAIFEDVKKSDCHLW